MADIEEAPARPILPRGARVAGPLSGPLGRQLLFWLVAISLTPLAVSNAVGYFRSETIIYGLVDRYLLGIAEVQALHVRDQVVALESAVREMASHVEIRALAQSSLADPDTNRLHSSTLLESLMAGDPRFEALYVFSDNGEILASAPLGPADLDRWIAAPLRAPPPSIEIVRESSAPGYPRVRISTPLSFREGMPPQVFLGASVSIGTDQKFLDIAAHTAGNVETFVIDQDGRPVFVSHPHGDVDYRATLDTPLLGRTSGASATYQDRQGVQVLGTLASVPNTPWQIVTEVPLSDAFQELRTLRRLSLWLGGLLSLLVLGFAWFTAARIVAPIQQLVSATRRLGSGDPGARVHVGVRNEIGELGLAFNEMAGDLSRASTRVEELHRHEMERAGQLATVGELAAGVAHEIKNPVAGISGGMDLVMRRIGDDSELQVIVGEMRRQISRIDVAVRDLLAFARPADPEFAPTSVSSMVERALTLVRPATSTSEVALVLDLAPDLPDVLVDGGLVQQALVNLMVNGVQATPAGGRVTVTSGLVAQRVELRIEDTGKGISEDDLQRIFKPFFTTRHLGTGLGLSITRSIIERQNGTITVESVVGEGSTFIVSFPIIGAEETGSGTGIGTGSAGETNA